MDGMHVQCIAKCQTIGERKDKAEKKGGSVKSPPPNTHTTTKPFHTTARAWAAECAYVNKTRSTHQYINTSIHQYACKGSGQRGTHGLSAASELHVLVARSEAKKKRANQNEERKKETSYTQKNCTRWILQIGSFFLF